MEENPENLFCKKCLLQFNEKDVYDMHLSSGHEITIQQAVDDLNFKLSKKKQEDNRLMPTTNHAKEHFCEKCSLQFDEKAVYDIHFVIEHENMNVQAFDVKKQEDNTLKPRIKNAKSNEVQQAVDDLNFILSKNKQEDNRSMPTTNHAKELFCEKCSLQFDEKAVYDIHFLIEHENMNEQAFDVKNQEDNTLKPRTKNAKSNEVPLEQTAQPKRKGKHIASIHEGKKLYNCMLCDNNFIYRISLKEHICSVLKKNNP